MKVKLNSIKREIRERRGARENLVHVSNTGWYSLFKDEIRNSIAIEGVFTNRQDLIDVLERNKRTDEQKAASILGYYESALTMYEYAANQYKENEFFLRMADIKQIHTLLMRYEKNMGEIGTFRNTRAEVAQSTFTPISEFHIRQIMELFLKWVNYHLKEKTYDPVLLAAIAHVWFESIHPFRDGNGRAGRILLSYILIGCGFINIAIKGISKKDRNFYYKALEKADDGFETIHREVEKGKQYTINEVDQHLDKNNFEIFLAIVTHRLKDSVYRLKEMNLNNIDKEALLSLNDLAKIYDYSPNYLRNLINRGKIKGTKKGKTWYVRVKDMAAYIEQIGSK